VIARRVASDFSAQNGGTIIGHGSPGAAGLGCFATGCCIRYFDYNDTYLSKEPAHPSDNIAARSRRRKRRREWPRADRRDRARLRSAMPLLRRRPAFARAAGIIRPMARFDCARRRALMKLDRKKRGTPSTSRA